MIRVNQNYLPEHFSSWVRTVQLKIFSSQQSKTKQKLIIEASPISLQVQFTISATPSHKLIIPKQPTTVIACPF